MLLFIDNGKVAMKSGAAVDFRMNFYETIMCLDNLLANSEADT